MSTILSFLLLTVPALFTPGPNNLMLLSSTAKFGMRRTVPHGAGVVLGFTLVVFLVGLGLGGIFTALPWLQRVLKYVAAAYFLYMAYRMLGLRLGGEEENQGRPMRLIEAAMFQWINPKVWVIAPSFIAAFLASGDARFASLILIVFGTFLVSISSTVTWIVFGDRLQALLKSTGTERYTGVILAILMLTAVVLFLI